MTDLLIEIVDTLGYRVGILLAVKKDGIERLRKLTTHGFGVFRKCAAKLRQLFINKRLEVFENGCDGRSFAVQSLRQLVVEEILHPLLVVVRRHFFRRHGQLCQMVMVFHAKEIGNGSRQLLLQLVFAQCQLLTNRVNQRFRSGQLDRKSVV